jgi:hypothetical protein
MTAAIDRNRDAADFLTVAEVGIAQIDAQVAR